MAGSVNRVILVGNLGKDPEARNTQDGKKIVSLTLATSETWNDRSSGERKEKTEWHRVVVFNERAAEFADKYFKKGMKVYVEGSLQTRKWTDQQGMERYTTEIVVAAFSGTLTSLESVSNNGSGADGGDRGGYDRRDGGNRGGDDRRSASGGSRQGGGGGGGRGSASGGRHQDSRGGGGGGGQSWDAPGRGDLDDEIPF